LRGVETGGPPMYGFGIQRIRMCLSIFERDFRVTKAVKGDMKAIIALLPHILNVDMKEEEKKNVLSMINTDDREIIEAFAERLKEGEYYEVEDE